MVEPRGESKLAKILRDVEFFNKIEDNQQFVDRADEVLSMLSAYNFECDRQTFKKFCLGNSRLIDFFKRLTSDDMPKINDIKATHASLKMFFREFPDPYDFPLRI